MMTDLNLNRHAPTNQELLRYEVNSRPLKLAPLFFSIFAPLIFLPIHINHKKQILST